MYNCRQLSSSNTILFISVVRIIINLDDTYSNGFCGFSEVRFRTEQELYQSARRTRRQIFLVISFSSRRGETSIIPMKFILREFCVSAIDNNRI